MDKFSNAVKLFFIVIFVLGMLGFLFGAGIMSWPTPGSGCMP